MYNQPLVLLYYRQTINLILMENWITASTPLLFKVFLSVLVIFSIIIFITRVSGLRTFAKMSSFDFASTIAIGSILASVILNTNQSLLKGAIALSGIVLFQSVFALVVRKSEVMNRLLTNAPTALMYKGEILYDNLSKTNVGEDDLIAKLREANALNFSEVHAVILESTGDMSVLHGGEGKPFDQRLFHSVKGLPEEAER